MKIIDHEGRLFGKISILDVLVIAVVLVLALAFWVKNTGREITSGTVENTTITFQLRINNVRQGVADSLAVGDLLFDPDRSTGGALGRITDIQVEPGTDTAELHDGRIIMAPCDGRVNVIVNVQGSGRVTEQGVFAINRIYELGVNANRSFNTKYAAFIAKVTDIY